MAGFLRKKPKQDTASKSKAQPPPPPKPADSLPTTPLFAKFATTPSSDGVDSRKPVVSGPMMLTSRETMSNPQATGQIGQLGMTVNSGFQSPKGVAHSGRSSQASPTRSPTRPKTIDKPLPNPVDTLMSPSSSPGPSHFSQSSILLVKSTKQPDLERDGVDPSYSRDFPQHASSSRASRRISSVPSTQYPLHNPAVASPSSPRSSSQDRKSSASDLRHREYNKLGTTGVGNDVSSFPSEDRAKQAVNAGPPSAYRSQIVSQEDSSSSLNDSHSDDFDLWLKSSVSHSSATTDSSPVDSGNHIGIARKGSQQSLAPAERSLPNVRKSSNPTFTGPVVGKPLIFSTIATVAQEDSLPLPPPPVKSSGHFASPSADPALSYPSPPAEYGPSPPSPPVPRKPSQASYPTQTSSSSPTGDSTRRHSVLSSRHQHLPSLPSAANVSMHQSHDTESYISQHTPRKASTSGHSHTPRTLTKPRPATPTRQRPSTPKNRPVTPVSPEKNTMSGNVPERNTGLLTAALIDDDPFAKTQSIKLLKPSSRDGLPSRDGLSSRDGSPPVFGMSHAEPSTTSLATSNYPHAMTSPLADELDDNSPDTIHEDTLNQANSESIPPNIGSIPLEDIPSTSSASPEDYKDARARRRGGQLEKEPPTVVKGLSAREDRPAEPFPLPLFLAEPALLGTLISFLSFFEWCNLLNLSKKIRAMLTDDAKLKEEVLERFLHIVGYSRWAWSDPEPLTLSLADLHNYMRGVSIPTHEYARVADLVLRARTTHPTQQEEADAIAENALQMKEATRAYNRVLLRLRVQAEKESMAAASSGRPGMFGGGSRPSSRAPSPTRSSTSHGANILGASQINGAFSSASRSPLFRFRRAPLLRVFVPSPEGDWLSDASVLQCEAELKRPGLQGLMRFGDVVWDIAVGDEGNVGRMIWDGTYLIDLDYTYSTVGDLPKYVPALAFPPSYFHRVIRTGPTSSNPIIRIDLTPWGPEIAANLQLLQDRVRTETPQGTYHNVVRWVHRSSFVIRPQSSTPSRKSSSRSQSHAPSQRIPIPDHPGLYVDAGWYGTIVVETEGTNEALADFQERCGPGAFPPRVQGAANASRPAALKSKEKDARMVFRVLREKSRPGEIWIRAASAKERLM